MRVRPLSLEFFTAEVNALAAQRGTAKRFTEDQLRSLWQQGFNAASALRLITQDRTA
jgi:hypothetical protein